MSSNPHLRALAGTATSGHSASRRRLLDTVAKAAADRVRLIEVHGDRPAIRVVVGVAGEPHSQERPPRWSRPLVWAGRRLSTWHHMPQEAVRGATRPRHSAAQRRVQLQTITPAILAGSANSGHSAGARRLPKPRAVGSSPTGATSELKCRSCPWTWRPSCVATAMYTRGLPPRLIHRDGLIHRRTLSGS